jgi:hypothetical protein
MTIFPKFSIEDNALYVFPESKVAESSSSSCTTSNETGYLPSRDPQLEQENELISQEIKSCFAEKKKRKLEKSILSEKMHLIIRDVYLGDINACKDWFVEADRHPNQQSIVISMTNVHPHSSAGHPNNVHRLEVNIADDQSAWLAPNGIRDNLKKIFELIDYARAHHIPLLIHCLAGKSRSSTILTAYLMWACRQTMEPVLYFVQTKRFWASPSDGMREVLCHFQNMLIYEGILSENSVVMRK